MESITTTDDLATTTAGIKSKIVQVSGERSPYIESDEQLFAQNYREK